MLCPMVVLGGGAFSHERGSPVAREVSPGPRQVCAVPGKDAGVTTQDLGFQIGFGL